MLEDSVTLIRVRSRQNRGNEGWKELPFEPTFFEPGSRLLPALPNPKWRDRYAQHLGFHVSNQTLDLLAHVRRILLWSAAGNRQATYLAIADLFQVLGTKGVDLRRDMLNRVSNLLSPMQVSNLNAQLLQSESVTTMLDLPTSRFSTKHTPRLVVRREVERPQIETAADPLKEARDFLDSGQVDLAQQILESALPQDVSNSDMHKELLEIYRRSGDLGACESMRDKITGADKEIERAWTDTITMLRTGEFDFRPKQPS
ncbi:MAG: hypothetical protein U1F34_08710 [Gammaproteobacteria bacterium]